MARTIDKNDGFKELDNDDTRPTGRWTAERMRWAQDEGEQGPATVLLAEDDHDLRSLVATALRRSGYAVIEAKDGNELLQMIGNSHLRTAAPSPDLVISDVRMPKWSGLEVLAGLRGSDWSMPVILITAFGDKALHDEAYRLGAVTTMDKPFDIDELVAIANDIVPPKFASAHLPSS